MAAGHSVADLVDLQAASDMLSISSLAYMNGREESGLLYVLQVLLHIWMLSLIYVLICWLHFELVQCFCKPANTDA